ncbi:MAG TPA: hypothetical protein VM198_01820 [Longimicrobiales bacterium]|nr:hypothetical protein [Longimicrobiales bacterium]
MEAITLDKSPEEAGPVAEQYGASRGRSANRFLFVIGPAGKVVHRHVPFQEVDPTSYEQLGDALDEVVAVASRQLTRELRPST